MCDPLEEADRALDIQETDMCGFEETVRDHRRPIQLQSERSSGCTAILFVARWFLVSPSQRGQTRIRLQFETPTRTVFTCTSWPAELARTLER